jgi:hypothetical protein
VFLETTCPGRGSRSSNQTDENVSLELKQNLGEIRIFWRVGGFFLKPE